MTNHHTGKLKNITQAVLRSQTVREEMDAAKRLATWYRGQLKEDMVRDNESSLMGGLALSSYDAAICVDEYLRTTRFIKGVYHALQELLHRFPNEKIHVFYAGCGPFATLVFPLLPLIDQQKLEISMLDIHTSSLQCVQKLLDQNGFEQAPVQLIEGNAITYQSQKPIHLLVTETMYNALVRETQVPITKNLAAQLVSDGILVPEEIGIDLVYTFFAHEPHFNSVNQEELLFEDKYEKRQVVERIFSLNRERDFFDASPNDKFLSKEYKLPADYTFVPDICLFTEVRIFNGITLGCAESSITNPYGIASALNFEAGAVFRLEYSFDHSPRWEMKKPC